MALALTLLSLFALVSMLSALVVHFRLRDNDAVPAARRRGIRHWGIASASVGLLAAAGRLFSELAG